MLSKANGRVGRQEPQLRIEPLKCAYTDGPDAALLIKEYGFELDPWQELVLNAWAARDEQDAPLYLTCGLSCPRQNGKNGILEAYEFYKMIACGEKILHTAHLVGTAKKSFERLSALFENPENTEIQELVRNIRRTNGEQGIYLNNGAYIEYASRSRGGGRGSTYSIVVFDEAQELTDDQVEALMPTLAASPTGYRQLIYTGTPPGPNCPGTVFAQVRSSSINNKSKTMCWHEWGIDRLPEPGSTFVDVLDFIYETNPAMGLRLDEEFTENEFNTMTLEGFARERLGFWAATLSASFVISKELWEEAKIESIGNKYRTKTGFAVKFSADGSHYALAGVKTNARGESAVELIELKSTIVGTRDLARALYDRRNKACCVVVDGLSVSDALLKNLEDLKAPKGYVIRPSTADVISAASGFVDELKNKKVKHTDQPQLNDSATGSIKRTIGSRGGWSFGDYQNHSSTAIEAVALALWGIRNTRRNPKRKQRLL